MHIDCTCESRPSGGCALESCWASCNRLVVVSHFMLLSDPSRVGGAKMHSPWEGSYAFFFCFISFKLGKMLSALNDLYQSLSKFRNGKHPEISSKNKSLGPGGLGSKEAHRVLHCVRLTPFPYPSFPTNTVKLAEI